MTLTSKQYAFYVFAELAQTRCDWDDNALTLYPGERVTLHATPSEALSREEFIAQLHITTLSDIGRE